MYNNKEDVVFNTVGKYLVGIFLAIVIAGSIIVAVFGN